MKDLSTEEANNFYTALVGAAFIEAAQHHFIKNGEVANEAQMIGFVSQVLESSGEYANLINPQLAQSILLDLLEKGTMIDAEPGIKFGHQIVMLSAMAGERDFSSRQLEEFLQIARPLARRRFAQITDSSTMWGDSIEIVPS